MRKIALLALLSGLALVLAANVAVAASTQCGNVQTITTTSHQWVTSLGTNCQFSQSQPAVGDLANVGGGTVLGNSSTSSAAPSATTTPTLGIAGTSTGTIGLSNSAGGTVTLQGGSGAVTNYTLDFPTAAPSTNGQALTATTAGVGSWSTVLAAKFTNVSKTTGYTVTSADDATRFDNTGAGGSVIFTLPAAPAAGDEWCFAVSAAQTVEVLANTGQTISVGGATSASAGNIQSNTQNSSVCLYYMTTALVVAEAVTGPWQVN